MQAATVRRAIKDLLRRCAPNDWTVRMLPAPASGDVAGQGVDQAFDQGTGRGRQPDIVLISPAGRCYFLFVKAPHDRWWDGDLRRVDAEKVTEDERSLMITLKRAGNGARAVWSTEDAKRALAAWGCRLTPDRQPAQPSAGGRQAAGPAQSAKRPTLRFWRGA
ncbi:hypothetical protein [Pelagibius sp.]|uniref:hypothetical protein n=1 Tax=Pelagibius sp. TaxID=1931238 RepID=UPI0026105DDB|nr:hypothetical protein [Pelagibius sp.]